MYTGETLQGQKVVVNAGNGSFIVITRIEDGVPVLGEAVIYLLGQAPLVVKGEVTEVADALRVTSLVTE